jgi:hypothetical protein
MADRDVDDLVPALPDAMVSDIVEYGSEFADANASRFDRAR